MESEATSYERKRSREDNSSPEFESTGDSSPEAKRLRDELLDILDDDATAGDVDAGGDLATFMKSFEDEISFSMSPAPYETADGGESSSLTPPPLQQPDLGFLLEASDDELGLPPPSSSPEDSVADDGETGSGKVEFGQIWGFEEDNGFGFDSEIGIRSELADGDGGVVYDGELFDYADVFSGPSDLTWRQETLPAV